MNVIATILYVGFLLYLERLSRKGTALRSAKSIRLRRKPLWTIVVLIPLACYLMGNLTGIAPAFASAGAYLCFRFGWRRVPAILVWLFFVATTPGETGLLGTLIGAGITFCVDMTWNWWMKKTDLWFKEEGATSKDLPSPPK